MFGYITVNKDTLSEENKKIYQSYYCGLCQTMKSQYGRRAQMALNYDMTFLIVLLTGLYEPDSVTRDGLYAACTLRRSVHFALMRLQSMLQL